MNYKTRQPFPHAAYVEGQRNFTYFDRSLTAGLTDVIIESPGDFLYIDQASTGVVSVELNMRQGGTLAPILLAAGGSIECDFASIKLTASAQLGKTVRIVVGNGARIKSGGTVNPSSNVVSVVDGGRQRSEAEKAFFATIYKASVAAEMPHVQLWNPSTTQRNIFVEKVSIVCGTTTSGHLRHSTTALSSVVAPFIAAGCYNKKVGGAASVAEVRSQGNATSLGDGTLLGFYLQANTITQWEFREPVMLPPGSGLIVSSNAVNVDIGGNFEFFEE